MPLTIDEIESACAMSNPPDFSMNEFDGPELSLKGMFYPFGFPVEVRTNSRLLLEQFEVLWGKFYSQHGTEPIRCDVRLVESDLAECPPEPTYRTMLPFLMCVADKDNYAIIDMEGHRTKTIISNAALRYPLYARYFFLGLATCCLEARDITSIHAGCVALDGKGVLFCGDSGAGKSTLSYGCARAGFTYVSDDGALLLNGGTQRIVTGDCHLVRFRPSSADLFPELRGLELTPRIVGAPSIELPTAPMKDFARAQTTHVDYIVFLKRNGGGPPQLVPYSKEVARHAMRQILWGSAESRAKHYAAIDRLLTAEVFQLRYTDLNWAIERVRKLAQEGQ